jgi:nucleoside-diphosphate-sugar epimerase
LDKANVLVTGGAGFIGSHLVDALVEQGHRVRVLDALVDQVHGANAAPAYLNPAAEFVRGDVCDRDTVDSALEGIDVVFHEAAEVGVGQSMYEIHRYVRANASVRTVCRLLAEGLRVDVSPEIVAKYREGDIRHCVADISKARSLLGYEPKVSLERGIPELLSWVGAQAATDQVASATAELESRQLVR